MSNMQTRWIEVVRTSIGWRFEELSPRRTATIAYENGESKGRLRRPLETRWGGAGQASLAGISRAALAMAEVTPLQRYRAHLEAVDREAERTPPDEYIDLLTAGEVIDLLVIRDEIDEFGRSPDEQSEIDRLDDLLVKHHRLMVDNVPPYPEKPRSHWWWHLHEGPHVRAKTRATAKSS